MISSTTALQRARSSGHWAPCIKTPCNLSQIAQREAAESSESKSRSSISMVCVFCNIRTRHNSVRVMPSPPLFPPESFNNQRPSTSGTLSMSFTAKGVTSIASLASPSSCTTVGIPIFVHDGGHVDNLRLGHGNRHLHLRLHGLLADFE
eukprot:UN4051